MGLDKETSRLIALQYASQKLEMLKKHDIFGQGNDVEKFAFDFLEAYARCRSLPIQAAQNKYWKEVADDTRK